MKQVLFVTPVLTVVCLSILAFAKCTDDDIKRIRCDRTQMDFYNCLDKLPEWNKNGDMGKRECERLAAELAMCKKGD